jgi:hypothetical protein
MVALASPAYQVLISNFERAYPNITVDVTWSPSSTDLYQLETTELQAGNAPDLLTTTVGGSGTPIAVCVLARAADLAPMLRAPWTKWSPRLLTSLDKYGQGLFAFTPAFSVFGVFTDNELFSRLGLTVPQTFSQLLAVCQKAHSAGMNAVQLGAAICPSVSPALPKPSRSSVRIEGRLSLSQRATTTWTPGCARPQSAIARAASVAYPRRGRAGMTHEIGRTGPSSGEELLARPPRG